MAKAKKASGLTRAQVDEFELVSSQLDRLHAELQALAKGKAHDALNAFKVGLLNKLLVRANALLGSQYEAVPGFTQFDPDELPSSSDALVVVSQYLGALEKLRADNVALDYGTWYWVIDGSSSNLHTAPPAKLGRK